VMWRTTYEDGSYAAWAAVSPAGDGSFRRPVQLSSKRSPGPVSQVAGDDNSTVALDRTTLHAVWGDRREGSLGVHYGRYHFAADRAALQPAPPSTPPVAGTPVPTRTMLPATGQAPWAAGGAVLLLVGATALRRRTRRT
jgi:hypothetical protein